MPSDSMLERARAWQARFSNADPVLDDSCHKPGDFAMLSTVCVHDLVAFAREEVARKLETAADGLVPSRTDIRLHAGEMTAQEMRTVEAVLHWRAHWLRAEAQRVREGKDDD